MKRIGPNIGLVGAGVVVMLMAVWAWFALT